VDRLDTPSAPLVAAFKSNLELFLCNANDIKTVLAQDNDDTLLESCRDGGGEQQAEAKEIPEEPQLNPSPTAALRKLTVHFDTSKSIATRLVGFTMLYSDGMEFQESLQGCDLRGTKRSHFQLHPNVHIVHMVSSVKPDQQDVRIAVCFFTTERRRFEIYVGGGHLD
jgi:hypothetical protein